jgi:hypothetical protein
MSVFLDLKLRARTIAASMAIGRPEGIDGTPRRGSTAKEELSCLARNDGEAGRGRKFRRRRCAQAIKASAGLRPDQAIEEAAWVRWIGQGSRMENVAMHRDRRDAGYPVQRIGIPTTDRQACRAQQPRNATTLRIPPRLFFRPPRGRTWL